MAKLFLVTVCVLAGVLAEPPSGYQPPQARNSLAGQYGPPSQQGGNGGFGGRSSGRSFSYNSLAENQFGGSSRINGQSRFGSSARQQPSQKYNAPNEFDNSVVTNAAGRFNQNRQTSSFRQQSAPQFNAPSFRQQPSSSYNAPAARQQPTSSYAAPSARLQPSSQYGAPFAKKMDDDLAEPANYEYNYEVQAAEESGAEFGHQETREDDFAQGEYHVLLPDGRMQIVEYEADEEGFRPRIRYEETGYPDARASEGPY